MTLSPLKRAIQLVGGQTAMAALCGIRPPSVCNWGDVAPLDRVPAIEQATKGQVKAEELRPDVVWVRKRGRIVGYTIMLS